MAPGLLHRHQPKSWLVSKRVKPHFKIRFINSALRSKNNNYQTQELPALNTGTSKFEAMSVRTRSAVSSFHITKRTRHERIRGFAQPASPSVPSSNGAPDNWLHPTLPYYYLATGTVPAGEVWAILFDCLTASHVG